MITFSEAVDPASIIGGWDGTAIDVQAAIIDGGGTNDDLLRVYSEAAFDPATFLPAGTIDVGRWDFVTSGSYAAFGLATAVGGTSSTMMLADKVLTITLGSLDFGTSSTSTSSGTERYTPPATLTDLAGNSATTSTISASGGSHKAF